MKIIDCLAREVLDSRGYPTVEVELTSENFQARAIVPSGASTGEGEALELRDGDSKRYQGKGVLKAVQNVQKQIGPAIIGKEFVQQSILDSLLRKLDGTSNKSHFGANAILPVSMAYARLSALENKTSLSAGIAKTYGTSGLTLPVPMMNIFNGGKHADNGIAIQEFMIIPAGFNTFSESLRAGVEVFHQLKKILHNLGLTTAVGDEGGFAPKLNAGEAEAGPGSHEKVLTLLLEAIDSAGYKAGSQIFLALDCAASEFLNKDKKNTEYWFEGSSRTSNEMIHTYDKWVSHYPIISIEDGLAEHE